MNSETETLLLQEVAPRLRAAIPKTIPIVGSDDPEELLQDGLAIAIHIHRGARKARKKVSEGNIAHYAILALRSGRRSTGFKQNDVLHPAAQLNRHARVQSLDVEGRELTLLVSRLMRSRSALQDRKQRLGQLIREHLGEDILRQVQLEPSWTNTLDALRARLACRAARRTA